MPAYKIGLADGALVWHCEKCGEPIEDLKGTLSISYAAINAEEAAIKRAQPTEAWGPVNLAAIMDAPGANWAVLHHDCDPNIDGAGQYHWDVARIRTLEAVLNWTAHLLETKDWLGTTNWGQLLYSLPGVGAAG